MVFLNVTLANRTYCFEAELAYISLVTLIDKCHPSICALGHGFETSKPTTELFPVAFGRARFASQESRSNNTALPATMVPPLGQPERPETLGARYSKAGQYDIGFILVDFPRLRIAIRYTDPSQVVMCLLKFYSAGH